MVRLRAKCLVVGDATVGKTALCQMFHNEGTLFSKNYTMTIGVELHMKCVNIPENDDSVELYIVDSAGKQELVEYSEKMWGEPSLLCLVFDVTSEESFSNCSHWVEKVRAHCKEDQIPGILVGNKTDLTSRRQVQASVAQEWAQSQGLEYHETSAKEKENCSAPFLSLARAFHSLYLEHGTTIQKMSLGRPPQ